MISRLELEEAHQDGAGFCLFCAARSDDLPSPYASQCDECGHTLVVPAATILTFLAWLDLEDD